MRFIIVCILLLCPFLSVAQHRDSVALVMPGGNLYGTLTLPNASKGGPSPLVIIIAGSGPTDRDGNQRVLKNNSLLYLADSLAKRGIATLRYDKRGIGASKSAAPDESALKFSEYVTDAAAWVNKYTGDKRFNKIFIAGHSEGALIGTLAAQQSQLAGFISISGVAFPADSLIIRQITASPMGSPRMVDSMKFLFQTLRREGHVDNVPDGFYQAILRKSVQPYMISWIKYNPTEELAKLRIPILVVQGTTDMQVDTTNAILLAAANPNAKLVIITGMNHVMKDSPMDPMENQERYVMPDFPLNRDLVNAVSSFVLAKRKK